MASGSFNIDTYSWYRSLPLSNDSVAYPFLTMFAVGESSFLKAYSFSNYQSAAGYCNTIQLSNIFISTLDGALLSTYNFIGKIYQSTIPTTPFRSTYNTFTYDYGTDAKFTSPTVEFGALSSLIQTGKYNVFIEFQYNIWLSTPFDTFTNISTIGYIGDEGIDTNPPNVQTRVGNLQFQTIRQELMFAPGTLCNFGGTTSNFKFDLTFQSTSGATGTKFPAYDIFIPGNNNYTFTFMPIPT
jgi:hypothetical protein